MKKKLILGIVSYCSPTDDVTLLEVLNATFVCSWDHYPVSSHGKYPLTRDDMAIYVICDHDVFLQA